MVTLFCLFAAYRLHMKNKEALGWCVAAGIFGVWADTVLIEALGDAF